MSDPDKKARAQRALQAQQAERDANEDANKDEGKSLAMQAGARRYPEPPFPKQHQAKPGEEQRLSPAPMFEVL